MSWYQYSSVLGFYDQLEVIGEVIEALSSENTVFTFQECLDGLKRACSFSDSEPKKYDLSAPALVPWQVEVCI